MATPDELVILTGGPGAGKTTLLEALRERGYAVVPESSRAIIRDQLAIGGSALHGKDFALAEEVGLSWDMRAHHEARQHPGPVFFDRGVPDWVGYHPLMGGQTPAHVLRAAQLFRYHQRVFVAPPWPEIYVNDAERKQDWAEAERSYEVLVAGYRRVGYQLVELPRTDVPGRVAAVLGHLGFDL